MLTIAAALLLAGCGDGAAPEQRAASEAKQLWTCSMHPQVIQDHPGDCPICGMELEPVSQSQSDGTHEGIRIDPVMVQNMGVRTVNVRQGDLTRGVRASAVLRDAEPNVHEINLRVSGWIERLIANTEGMTVRQGDALFELYSPELQIAVEELIAARRSPASQSQKMMFDAARRKLALLGIDAPQIDELSKLDAAPPSVTFRSPIDGVVTEKSIFAGTSVEAGASAMRIVDRSTLWLDAQVHAQDIPLVALGQNVQASVESTREPLAGKVIFISPSVDPETRATSVRIAIPNPSNALRPGMFATASIETRIADSALIVPRSAIIDTGTRQVVFVALDDTGHFEPRDVAIGSSGDDGNVQVLEGLKPEDSVVVSGQFLLDSESRVREALAKYQSESLQAPTGGHQH